MRMFKRFTEKVVFNLLNFVLFGIMAEHHISINKGLEYCNLETFNVSCDAGEVILIEHAHYGRMKIGRCVQNDLGFLGCTGDALRYVDSECSAKEHCTFPIPNAELGNVNPCSRDVQPYLEVLHHCVRVVENKNMLCHTTHELNSKGGYLSSTPAAEYNLGTKTCPWKIIVDKGQRISFQVLHFSIPEHRDGCVSYGNFVDSSGHIEAITVCHDDHRQKHAYTSSSHEVEIVFHASMNSNGLAPVLIKYEALGCASIPPQANRHVKRIDDDRPGSSQQIQVNCNNSGEVWFLSCKGTDWIGILGNCSSDGSSISGRNPLHMPEYSFPFRIAAVVAVGVMLGVFLGGTLLICASVYFKRKQTLHRQRMYEYDIDYGNKEGNNRATLQRHAYHCPESSTNHPSGDEESNKTIGHVPRMTADDFVFSSSEHSQTQQQQKTIAYHDSPNHPSVYDQNNTLVTLQCKPMHNNMRKGGHIYEYPSTFQK